MSSYDLAFYGELEPGANLEECKAKLGELFKANDAQLAKMFSGQRIVLKSKLDEATGKKYMAALSARGATCKLELIGGASAAPEKTAPPTATPPSEPAYQAASSEPDSVTDASRADAGPATTGSNTIETPEGALPVAGQRVDEVLSGSDLSLDPVGVDLAEQTETQEAPVLTQQDSLSIAPAGSDLVEKKPDQAVDVPDVSHLSIQDS